MYDREIVHMPDGGAVALDTEDLPAAKVGWLRGGAAWELLAL